MISRTQMSLYMLSGWQDNFLQVAIEAIYVAVQTIVYSILLFSMMGFEWTAAKFLWFYYFIFMCFVYFTLFGMMVVALTPAPQIAAICMSFFTSFWNLFSGFLLPRPVSNLKLSCIIFNKSFAMLLFIIDEWWCMLFILNPCSFPCVNKN